MGAGSILRIVNGGLYINICTFKYDEYKCCTKNAFIFDSHFKTLHQSKCCGFLIDNRDDAPIFVLKDKEIETNLNLR